MLAKYDIPCISAWFWYFWCCSIVSSSFCSGGCIMDFISHMDFRFFFCVGFQPFSFKKDNHFVFSWIILITLIGVWDKTFKINLIYVLKCDNFFTHFFYLSNFITCIAKFPYTKLNNIFIILLVIHLENILKFLNQYLNFVNQY